MGQRTHMSLQTPLNAAHQGSESSVDVTRGSVHFWGEAKDGRIRAGRASAAPPALAELEGGPPAQPQAGPPSGPPYHPFHARQSLSPDDPPSRRLRPFKCSSHRSRSTRPHPLLVPEFLLT